MGVPPNHLRPSLGLKPMMTWGYPILETPMLICGRHLPFSGKHGFRPSLIWMCLMDMVSLKGCFEPMLGHKP